MPGSFVVCVDRFIQDLFCFVVVLHNSITVFQLYHGGDMMHEMRRRNPEPTLLPTREIFNVPYHTGMV